MPAHSIIIGDNAINLNKIIIIYNSIQCFVVYLRVLIIRQHYIPAVIVYVVMIVCLSYSSQDL